MVLRRAAQGRGVPGTRMLRVEGAHGRAATFDLTNTLLDCLVDAALNVVQALRAVQLAAHHLIRSQEGLQLIAQLEVLIRHHVHVTSQLVNLILHSLTGIDHLMVLRLPVSNLRLTLATLTLTMSQFPLNLSTPRLKLITPHHLIFKCFLQLRLCRTILPILLLKIANFIIHLLQLKFHILYLLLRLSIRLSKPSTVLLTSSTHILQCLPRLLLLHNIISNGLCLPLYPHIIPISLHQPAPQMIKSLHLCKLCLLLILNTHLAVV